MTGAPAGGTSVGGGKMKKAVIIAAAAGLLVAAYLVLSPDQPVRNAERARGPIVCFGDSLTYGTGASLGMDYPSQLSGLLGVPVINAGRPGDTTADALKRLHQDVLSHSPGIVLITLGGNDLKNRLPRQEAFANLKAIIEQIQESGALVVVGGIRVPLLGRGFDEEYERVCSQTGALLIPDIFEGLLGRDEFMSDPIHPNNEGYRIIAERFHAALRSYL